MAAAAAGEMEEATVAAGTARVRRQRLGRKSKGRDEGDLSTGDTINTRSSMTSRIWMEELDEIVEEKPMDLHDYASSSVIVPAQQPAPAAPPARPTVIAPTTTRPYSPSSGNFFGRLGVFPSALLSRARRLARCGGLLPVRSQLEPIVETPVITEMKSNNVPLNAFEEGRRLVDKDPAAYINANAARAPARSTTISCSAVHSCLPESIGKPSAHLPKLEIV